MTSDSPPGGTQSRSRHASLSRSMYAGCARSAGSAVHSRRHSRFSSGMWNSVWRIVADWTDRRRSLEYTAAGFANGHCSTTRFICPHPSEDNGARSKFEVSFGRTISPWRIRTRTASCSLGIRSPAGDDGDHPDALPVPQLLVDRDGDVRTDKQMDVRREPELSHQIVPARILGQLDRPRLPSGKQLPGDAHDATVKTGLDLSVHVAQAAKPGIAPASKSASRTGT